tara:strand:- start:450 stop:581 length:132 start_codon:yes stop_codon:yes gene_type:complete
MFEQQEQVMYMYVRNGKEFYTSNIDLAHKRADGATEIKSYKVY